MLRLQSCPTQAFGKNLSLLWKERGDGSSLPRKEGNRICSQSQLSRMQATQSGRPGVLCLLSPLGSLLGRWSWMTCLSSLASVWNGYPSHFTVILCKVPQPGRKLSPQQILYLCPVQRMDRMVCRVASGQTSVAKTVQRPFSVTPVKVWAPPGLGALGDHTKKHSPATESHFKRNSNVHNLLKRYKHFARFS